MRYSMLFKGNCVLALWPGKHLKLGILNLAVLRMLGKFHSIWVYCTCTLCYSVLLRANVVIAKMLLNSGRLTKGAVIVCNRELFFVVVSSPRTSTMRRPGNDKFSSEVPTMSQTHRTAVATLLFTFLPPLVSQCRYLTVYLSAAFSEPVRIHL